VNEQHLQSAVTAAGNSSNAAFCTVLSSCPHSILCCLTAENSMTVTDRNVIHTINTEYSILLAN
jgi:hypothetical protein